eukprot:9047280-Alexandrium_andersonii.AAC.1
MELSQILFKLERRLPRISSAAGAPQNAQIVGKTPRASPFRHRIRHQRQTAPQHGPSEGSGESASASS